MPSPVTRLAVAGAGWAGSVHAAAAALAPGAELAQVLSRTEASAAKLVELQRAGDRAVVAGTYDQLDPTVAALVVATPPDHHLELALRAIDAGMGVLVEKPLCATLEEADRLVEAAADSTTICAYAENLLFAPAVQLALDHRRGLGALRHLSARAVQSAPTWGHFLGELTVGGVLFDLGAHPVALILAAVAPARPVSVVAQLGSERDDGADDVAHVEVRFDHGLVATIDTSWRAEEPAWDLQMASDTGVVRLELLPEVLVESHGVDVTPPIEPGRANDLLGDFGYVGQLRGFVDSVAGRGGRVCPFGFARDVLDLTCAAYSSAGRGEPVDLPFAGPRDRTPLELWRGGYNDAP
jgi:myo-inositol 2-dehydrogenase/D-chiro-inositol 1-dehydrogenase